MPAYLIGLMFHEPGPYASWKRGLLEDYESSTGLFVEAASAEEAVGWGGQVGQALLRHVNRDDTLDWEALGYFAWVEGSPHTSGWQHCLDFFQHVSVGQTPDLERMTTEAYRRWLAENGPEGA